MPVALLLVVYESSNCLVFAHFHLKLLNQAAATTAALAKKYGADITVVGT